MKTHTLSLLALLLLASACKDKEKEAVAEGAVVAADGKVISSAKAHLPAGCELVVTADWQRLQKMSSVKDEMEAQLADFEKSPDEDAKEFRDFLKKTEIDPRKDPTDFAACLWDMNKAPTDATPPKFVAIVGGKFKPGAAADALGSVSERVKHMLKRVRGGQEQASDKPPQVVEIGGVKALFDEAQGSYLAQANDGAFVIGNERARFEQALKTAKAFESYPLASQPLGVAVGSGMAAAITPFLQQGPLAPAAPFFNGGSLGLEEQKLHVALHMKEEQQAKVVAQQVQESLNVQAQMAGAMPGHPMAQAIKDTKVSAHGKVLNVVVALPPQMMGGMMAPMMMPPGAMAAPPGAVPPGALAPGAVPPGAVPPGAVPPGAAPASAAPTPAPTPAAGTPPSGN